MSTKAESPLKGKLADYFRQNLKGWVILRHEDRFTHGIPDFSLTGKGKTIWIEVKHATPGFQSKGIQELTMSRLAIAGYAFYVVYYEKDKLQRTYIVEPYMLGKSPDEWTVFSDGFDHAFVTAWVKTYDYDRP